jgi:class 3 adenylate cyclase
MAEQESGIAKLLDLAREDPTCLEKLEKLRRTITVMFTDIQGSTAYFEKHGDAAGLVMVHHCNDILRRIVEDHRGRVIKTIGDGMMATFEECASSVAAAVKMQHGLVDLNARRPESDRVAIRIGIHYDTGIVRSHDVFGDVVNVASRIESVASPRQIVISDTLCQEVCKGEFEIQKLGRFVLKGKKSERTLYEVIWNQEPSGGAIGQRSPEKPRAGRSFRLQVVDGKGAIQAEHPLVDSLTIGRSQGDVTFPADLHMAPLNARVFVDDGQLFVQDLSQGAESIFIRVAGGYTLQNEDVVLMGNQVLKFREISGAMSVAAERGATLNEVANVLQEAVADLVQVNPKGGTCVRCPLSLSEVYLGRTKGTYTFPADKLMSRSHARVLQRAEDFILEDLDSRNGTFVKVRGTVPLAVNGMVLLGNQLLRAVRQ